MVSRLVTTLILVLVFPIAARAQFDTVINVPPDVSPNSIGSDTQLNLYDSGSIPSDFDAGVWNSLNTNTEVNIFGGSVGDNFEAVGALVTISGGKIGDSFEALNNSTVNITGGVVGNSGVSFGDSFAVNNGSTVNLSGGSVASIFVGNDSIANITGGSTNFIFADSDATVNFSGGEIGRYSASSGSVVNISDGKFGDYNAAHRGSIVNISGGTFGVYFMANEGSTVNISGGTFRDTIELTSDMITIFGGEFRLDGVPINSLDSPDSMTKVDLSDGTLLTGTLANGTPFAFGGSQGGSLTLRASSLPAVDAEIINVPNVVPPLGVRAGQTLNLGEGGVIGDQFRAGWGSTVNINGGSIGGDFEVVGAVVNISSGSIGKPIEDFFPTRFNVLNASTVNISGGTFYDSINAHAGSTINIKGGSPNNLWAFSDSTINISGGSVGSLNTSSGSTVNISGGSAGFFVVAGGSTANISGGSVGLRVSLTVWGTANISGGSFGPFGAGSGSMITFIGTEFLLDGNPISGLSNVGDSLVLADRGDAILSVTLLDGSQRDFVLSEDRVIRTDFFMTDATLRLTLATPVPEPIGIVTLLTGLTVMATRRRRGRWGQSKWRCPTRL